MSFTEVANCGINMKIPYSGIILTIYLVIEILGAQRYNCKKPTLKNGIARLRSSGRLVRFRCKKRFKLYGAKMAFCRNEEWTFPTPVCVANGRKCPKLKGNKDLLITKKMRGGLLKYSCKSGLKLNGSSTLYCDGSKWSGEVPQCIYEEPKKSCDFETADMCSWVQDESDTPYFDWTRTTAAKTRHSTGTGPDRDHTYPNKNTGHYLFMEASTPRRAGDYTSLLSPYYSSVGAGLCFEFWYHMLGHDGEGSVGSLKVGIKDSDASSLNLSPVWNISGNQGDSWHKGSLEIGGRNSFFQIVITGTRGEDHRGDIAIDDVSITNCTHDSITTESTTASITYTESSAPSKTITTNKAQQPVSATQGTSSVEATEKTQEAKTLNITTEMTDENITTQESTIGHTTLRHVTSSVATETKRKVTDLIPDTTTIPTGKASISITADTTTTKAQPSKQDSAKIYNKPTTNMAKSTTKSFVTTEFNTKPSDKETTSQQTTLTTTGFKTKTITTNQFRNPTTVLVATSALSSSQKPTKISTSMVESTVAATSPSRFTEMPTKIKTTVKSSTTTTTTSPSSSTTKPRKIRTTTLPASTEKLTTTATSQSMSTTKPTENPKTTEKSRTTTITRLPSSSTTKPAKIQTTLPASTKRLTTASTAATSPSGFTKKLVSTTVLRSTGSTTTKVLETSPTHSSTSKGKTKSSTRKETLKTTSQTINIPRQTIPTTTLRTTTVGPSVPSTFSYITTVQNFDYFNNTINENIITTHSTNDTDIPNIIVIGRQSASDDPPVRTLMIGLAAGVAIGLVIVVVGCYLWVRRKRRKELQCDEMIPITGTGSQEW